MNEDQGPDIVARMDQLTSGLKNWAVPVAGFYTALMEQGLSAPEAMTLTCQYVNTAVMVEPTLRAGA